ncbi:MAG: DUF305 domain-containing protein [Pseudomonadota bacterium]
MRLLTLFSHQSLFRFCIATIITLVTSLPLVCFSQSDSANNSSSVSGRHYGNISVDHHHMKMTGDTDYDFATMMRTHHEQGLRMAQNEIVNGKDATLRKLAKKIVATQKKELAEFDRWLAKHPPKTR